jgi:hypothetical protein
VPRLEFEIAKNKNGEIPDALLHQSDRGTPPDEATPKDSFYCLNFLTQRDKAKHALRSLG